MFIGTLSRDDRELLAERLISNSSLEILLLINLLSAKLITMETSVKMMKMEIAKNFGEVQVVIKNIGKECETVGTMLLEKIENISTQLDDMKDIEGEVLRLREENASLRVYIEENASLREENTSLREKINTWVAWSESESMVQNRPPLS